MATKKGTIKSEGYNSLPVIKGNKKVWFLNGSLVRIYHLIKINTDNIINDSLMQALHQAPYYRHIVFVCRYLAR